MATMGLSDGRWFDVADATKWESTGGTLFYIAGQWTTHDTLAALMGNTPAKLITETEALQWLSSIIVAVIVASEHVATKVAAVFSVSSQTKFCRRH